MWQHPQITRSFPVPSPYLSSPLPCTQPNAQTQAQLPSRGQRPPARGGWTGAQVMLLPLLCSQPPVAWLRGTGACSLVGWVSREARQAAVQDGGFLLLG